MASISVSVKTCKYTTRDSTPKNCNEKKWNLIKIQIKSKKNYIFYFNHGSKTKAPESLVRINIM